MNSAELSEIESVIDRPLLSSDYVGCYDDSKTINAICNNTIIITFKLSKIK